MQENQKQVEQGMEELNNQFCDFLKAKGLKAKFKLAFDGLAESAKKQHEKDVQNFNAVKAQSVEQNKDFVEFLQAKGLKAKFQIVVANIKRGIAESKQKTAEQIAKSKSGALTHNKVVPTTPQITADILTQEFNEFLEQKGLGDKFKVQIIEE